MVSPSEFQTELSKINNIFIVSFSLHIVMVLLLMYISIMVFRSVD